MRGIGMLLWGYSHTASRVSRRKPFVTFRYILYSKMNMNRNPRNPLKTNDPCTLYSIKNRDFAPAPGALY